MSQSELVEAKDDCSMLSIVLFKISIVPLGCGLLGKTLIFLMLSVKKGLQKRVNEFTTIIRNNIVREVIPIDYFFQKCAGNYHSGLVKNSYELAES